MILVQFSEGFIMSRFDILILMLSYTVAVISAMGLSGKHKWWWFTLFVIAHMMACWMLYHAKIFHLAFGWEANG